MGLSIRGYARHRGVSHVAVLKAIETGRITPLPDGTIDLETADAQWAQNTLNSRQAEAPEPPAKPKTKAKARSDPASAVPMEPSNTQVPPLTGGTSLLQARTVNEVLKAQLNKVELAQRKKELVDRAQALSHVFKLARIERDAWLNWPARISGPLASQLGADPHTVHMVLETAVREHLSELGELQPRVD
jgi:hypothetical protein